MGFFDIFRRAWNAPPKHQYREKTYSKEQVKTILRSYAGAARGSLYQDWHSHGTSGNAEVNGSASTLRNRSRDLIRNDDYARGLVREFVKNVIYLGISFQAQVKQIKKNSDPADVSSAKERAAKVNDDRINDAIEKLWKRWGKADYCDVTGVDNFAALQKLIFRSYLESGEVFIRLVKQKMPGSPVSLAIEIIEADQVADDYNSTHNGNPIIMGIELNKWKRSLAYWIYGEHPGEYQFGATMTGKSSRSLSRIPATEIIHFYSKERPGTVRGVPLLHSAIVRLRHLNQYEEAELVAARAAANYMGIITSEQEDFSEPLTDHDGNPLTPDTPQEETLKPGIIKHLADGQKFDSFAPNRPNAAFVEFHRGQLRATAAGTGISYQEISRDTSQSNFSSARLDMISVRDIWKMLQADFISKVLQPIFEAWLEQAVLDGALSFPDYFLRPERYSGVKWQARGWGWVDPEKEQKGILLGLAGRTTSYSEVFAERGKDFAEELKVMARDEAMLKEYGMNPTILNQLLFGEAEGKTEEEDKKNSE